MKFKIKITIMLIIFTLLLFFPFKVDTKGAPLIEHSIKIGADNRLPPYSYVNDNGIFKGFYIDIIRAIAIEAGIDVELQPMPWYRLKSALKNNEIDAILGVNVDDKIEQINVSDPFLTSAESIFVRIDNKYIVNVEDLKNVRVAIQRGNITQKLISLLDNDKVQYVEHQQLGIQKLMNGKVDAFIGDRLSGLYTIQKWKQDNFIKIVGNPINTRTYGIGVRKGDKELLKLFNKGLRAIKDNGTYDKIYQKWFGETLNPDVRLIKKIATIIGIILICILTIIFFILRWNAALKKEVNKRTIQLDKANKQLLQQKKQLENEDKFKEEILNSVLSGIITFDTNMNISFINTSGAEIFGIKKQIILGKKISNTIFSAFLDENLLNDVLKKGKTCKNKEIEIKYADSKKTLNYNLYPLIERNLNITGGILSFKDITQEKKMRAELVRKDKIQALGMMVAGIAHEIRNPLTTIKTFIDLIPHKIDNKNFREKFMELVPNEINRLNSIITELLEYTRPKRPNKENINLKDLFNNISILFSQKFKAKDINFYVEVDENSYIYADKNQIKQVFINIIFNSLEAVSKSGNITIKSASSKYHAEITIEDDGCGIEPEIMDKIMDPFFTTKTNGTGLGLFICYQIIKENNGEINIDSQPGSGTKVTVKLPSRPNGRGKDE